MNIMAAKDYKICTALFNAYIAKTSKKNPNIMLADRRVITESEILELIDWYMSRKCEEEKYKDGVVYFESSTLEGKFIKMELIEPPVKFKNDE